METVDSLQQAKKPTLQELGEFTNDYIKVIFEDATEEAYVVDLYDKVREAARVKFGADVLDWDTFESVIYWTMKFPESAYGDLL